MRSACKKLEESNEKYGHGNNILFFNFKIVIKKLPKIKYVITRSFFKLYARNFACEHDFLFCSTNINVIWL